ncbi:hypothetical protein [Ruminococcus sp.]|nr:hypothetical protein [Ruminococcus sp.]
MLSGERKWSVMAFGYGFRSVIHKYETRLSEWFWEPYLFMKLSAR